MPQWRLALAALLIAGCTKATDDKQSLCGEEACSGHGRCIVEDGRPRCECDPAYAVVGLTCVANCLEVSCSDRGGCIVVENEPWCVCDQGYWANGLECLPDPPQSCAGQECSGHGVCVETENEPAYCICDFDWVPFGLSCVPANCHGKDCSGHGACVEEDGAPRCRCDAGYVTVGLGCVPADCSLTDCSGHGACVDDGQARCVCDHGYVAVGLECRPEACASEDCSGHGACVDDGGNLRCVCDPGYVADGLSCRPGCVELECSGHGACVQVDGSLRCICDPGYIANGQSCLPDGGGEGDSGADGGGDGDGGGGADGGGADSGGERVTAGLAAHYAFDDIVEPFRDLASADGTYPGVPSGSATYAVDSERGGVLTSSAGSALVLEGYPGILASSARTVSLWVKTTSQGDLISWGDGLVAGGRFRLWVGNQRISVWPGVVCVHTQDGPPNHCGTDVVTDGEWHHVAAVFAAGGSNVGILIFVDGKLQVETDNTSGVPVNTVAAGDAEVARDLDGAVDDLRIYDRALSVAEVKSLFNGKPCSLPADCDDGNACTTGTCLTSGRCDISPAPCYPNSCEQLWVETGAATDGDYTLYLDNDPARAFQGHCVGMGSVPRTYLSLVHTDNADGATQAVGENFAHTTQAPERTAWYSKVRLNPILPAINVDDRTYTTLLAPAGGETMAYAHAGGCTGFMVDDGRANVDLRGTPFAVATDEYWVSGGWQPYGTTNFPPDPDPGSSPHDDRKVVHITGGGYPGAHGPYPEHSGYNGATLDLRWQPD